MARALALLLLSAKVAQHLLEAGRSLRLTYRKHRNARIDADAVQTKRGGRNTFLRGRWTYGRHATAEIGIVRWVTGPDVRGRLVSFAAAGTVTVSLGANAWAGGDYTVAFGATLHLPAATLKVDGKAIVENGELKLP